jgi:hypothetical protein
MPRPKPVKEQAANVAVICNLTEQSYAVSRTFGVYPVLPVIAGIQYVGKCASRRDKLGNVELLEADGMPKVVLAHCKPGEEFALVEIQDAYATREETGEKRAKDLIGAYEIADDITRELNGGLVTGMEPGATAFAGLFVCKGDVPTEQELKLFRAALRRCDEQRVQNADNAWATYKNQMFCVDAIPAARRLGVEDREWLSVYRPTKDCPVCFTKLHPQASVCRSCGYVVDAKRAKELGFELKEVVEKPAAKS